MDAATEKLLRNIWYRASTLTERASSFQSAADSQQSEEMSKRLARWKVHFTDTEALSARLEMDGLSESEFLSLLSESGEQLQERMEANGVPGWIQTLQHALSASLTGGISAVTAQCDDRFMLDCLHIFAPLLSESKQVLAQGIILLVEQYPDLPFDPATIFDLLEIHLAQRLHEASLRALVLEMHVARLQNQLEGGNPQERFEHFLRGLGSPEALRAFLQEYPVLARDVLRIGKQWAISNLQLLQRLCSDWPELCNQLIPEQDPGKLVQIRLGAGDTHRDGQCVGLLLFSSGWQVVYKPRSLSLDQHFQELLIWLNQRGLMVALRPITILDRDCYGWCEFVDAQSCLSEEEVVCFYQRLGSLLALLYALDAGDFHHENLLAAGEHPVLVDLEALFSARLLRGGQKESATRSIHSNVAKTGLLPERLQAEAGGVGIDISGVGGKGGQLTPRPVAVWKETGTDQMHLEHERIPLSEGKNRPKLRGEEVDVQQYSRHLLNGFRQTYHLLMQHHEELIQQVLPRFTHDQTRAILRDSNEYAIMLFGGSHPQRLRDALDREELFEHLWKRSEHIPCRNLVIAAERQDLLQGDIPLFNGQPGSRDLFSSRGERIADACLEPALSFVSRRLCHMDEADLNMQEWIIQASLATLSKRQDAPTRPPSQVFQQGEVDQQDLLIHACALADRLQELALRRNEGLNWLGIGRIGEIQGEPIWNVQEINPLPLYDGTAGIVFFLAYLADFTGVVGYRHLAERALLTIFEHRDLLRRFFQRESPQLRIGAFEGLGSWIYLFTHLAQLWQDPSYLDAAQELLEWLEPLIELDESFDVMAGAAGAILSLLVLHQVAPASRALPLAVRCGEHLLRKAISNPSGIGWQSIELGVSLAGLSHGASGIALSLLRLSQFSAEPAFEQSARQALAYERSLFSPRLGNWPYLQPSGEKGQILAWCHGAPGVGLSRLAMLDLLSDEQLVPEIAIALESTIAHGFGANHSLCHGDLGNLELLLLASQRLAEPDVRVHLRRMRTASLHGIRQRGWVTGGPLGIETPGLMTGLAGIGYQLLRLAVPDRIPCLLLLAPPGQSAERTILRNTRAFKKA